MIYDWNVCILIAAVISELARSTKAFAELGGRTHPLIADIVVALVEMGWCCSHFTYLPFIHFTAKDVLWHYLFGDR